MKKTLLALYVILGIGWLPMVLQSRLPTCGKDAKNIKYKPSVGITIVEDSYSNLSDTTYNTLSSIKAVKYDSLFFRFRVSAQSYADKGHLNFSNNLFACDINIDPPYLDILQVQVFSDKSWSEDYPAGRDLADIINFKHYSNPVAKNVNQYVKELSGEGRGFLFFSSPPTEDLSHNLTFVFHFENMGEVVQIVENIQIKQ